MFVLWEAVCYDAAGVAYALPANGNQRFEVFEAAGRPFELPGHPVDLDPPDGQIPVYTDVGGRNLILWLPSTIGPDPLAIHLSMLYPEFKPAPLALTLSLLTPASVAAGGTVTLVPNTIDMPLQVLTPAAVGGVLAIAPAPFVVPLTLLTPNALVFGDVPLDAIPVVLLQEILPLTVDKGTSIRAAGLLSLQLSMPTSTGFTLVVYRNTGATVAIAANANGRLPVLRSNGTAVEIVNVPDVFPLTGEIPIYRANATQLLFPWVGSGQVFLDMGTATRIPNPCVAKLEIIPPTLIMGTKAIAPAPLVMAIALTGLQPSPRVLSRVEKDELDNLVGQLDAYLAEPWSVP